MPTTLADQFEAVAGVASAVGAYAASRNIDSDAIARGCGLDPARFGILGERVSLNRLCRFLEALALISGDDLFGLKSAEVFEKGASGPFGYALMSAPTIRDLLIFLGRNLHKAGETSICTLAIGARETHFEWAYSPLILHCDQYVDLGLVQTFRHLKAILGPDTNQLKLELTRLKPKNTNLHKELLTKHVSFGATVNAMIMPSEFLGRVNPNADPRLFKMMSQQMDAIEIRSTKSQDPVVSVKLHLAENLAGNVPTLAQEAERLGMSPRTLQRRLTDAGTSMQALLDQCRSEMAERLLLDTTLSLSAITYKLGFSAPAAFTRSAIRWFGVTPSNYRKAHRNQS